MPRKFPLAAVLAVRQQREELEERALTAILAEANGVRLSIAQVERQMLGHANDRVREVSASHSAAHHQASHANWAMLRHTRQTFLLQLETLERCRVEQQARYLRARSDREMLAELKAGQRAVWEAELRSKEAKRTDDLLAARRLRN